MAKRKSLQTNYRDTIEEAMACVKELKEDFKDYETQIEISEDIMYGGWFIEIWKL